MTNDIVQIDGLSRRFDEKLALDNVTLHIQSGCVYGLVGENGAGKTTLLKHLLGLYRAQAGSVVVFGCVPSEKPVEVLSKIGFLSEDRSMPSWMTVDEVTKYTASFYSDWDPGYAGELREMFELAPTQKLSSLSRGQKARVGLMLALAYRPDLLVLDEPSSGLDPVVRRDILSAIIRTVADEGRTVLFSSHLLDEVQRVADQFAMLESGLVTWSGSMDEALSSHDRMTVRFASRLATAPQLDGVLSVQGDGHEWTILSNGQREAVERQIAEMGGEIVERAKPSLEEIFVARHRGPSAPLLVRR